MSGSSLKPAWSPRGSLLHPPTSWYTSFGFILPAARAAQMGKWVCRGLPTAGKPSGHRGSGPRKVSLEAHGTHWGSLSTITGGHWRPAFPPQRRKLSAGQQDFEISLPKASCLLACSHPLPVRPRPPMSVHPASLHAHPSPWEHLARSEELSTTQLPQSQLERVLVEPQILVPRPGTRRDKEGSLSPGGSAAQVIRHTHR